MYKIAPITPSQDAEICQIIKSVGEDHGAVGDGFGPSDPEVLCISQHYHDESKSKYFVASLKGKVVGGSGIAALSAGSEICELRKLYLLPESRGLGIGKALTLECLKYAKLKGYRQCYLDTLSNMKPAIELYRQLGFKCLDKPLEEAPHDGCDVWMLKEL